MDAWERRLCKRKRHFLVWVTSDMLDAALALAILTPDVPAYLHIPSFFLFGWHVQISTPIESSYCVAVTSRKASESDTCISKMISSSNRDATCYFVRHIHTSWATRRHRFNSFSVLWDQP
jgi:hypothetical protein